MQRKIIIIGLFAGLGAFLFLALGLYLRSIQSKLEPVLSHSSIALEVQEYVVGSKGAEELIDFGYAELLVPSGLLEIRGTYDDLPIIGARSTESKADIVFFAPVRIDTESLLADYNAISYPPVRTLWELETLAFEVKPFSLHKMLLKGREEVIRLGILFIVKYVTLGEALEFWLFESDNLKARVAQYDDWSHVCLYLHDASWMQGIMIRGSVEEHRRIIDALVTNYRFLDGIQEADVRQLLESLNLPIIDLEAEAQQAGRANTSLPRSAKERTK